MVINSTSKRKTTWNAQLLYPIEQAEDIFAHLVRSIRMRTGPTTTQRKRKKIKKQTKNLPSGDQKKTSPAKKSIPKIFLTNKLQN